MGSAIEIPLSVDESISRTGGQVDLWSAAGNLPKDLLQVAVRQKDLQYSSRTRLVTTYMSEQQRLRRMVKDYQFGMLTMNEHWSSGLSDMTATLKHPHWLDKPGADEPFVTHDLRRLEPGADALAASRSSWPRTGTASDR